MSGHFVNGRRAGVFGLLGLLLGGCASFIVADSKPLPAERLSAPGSEHISQGGYRLASLSVSPDTPDLVVLVAISGGGKRSASFGYGALRGMRDVMIPTAGGPRSLLSQLSFISGVSGGSFPASYYGLYREKAFGRFEEDFLYQDTNAYIFGTYLLPWNWAWLVQPGVGTNDFMDRVYDRTMFRGATFKDLEAQGRPLVAIGATDISYGTPFLFTQESFDLICSDLSQLPLSRAVAASNGFPGLFSPVNLTNRAAACGGRRPAWLDRVPAAVRKDPLSRVGVEATKAEKYLDADRTRYLHLSDGGVSDNLAMRSAGTAMQTFTPTDVRARGRTGVRRILLISVDGQGSQDNSVARRREVGGMFAMLGLVSGGQIDNYNFETMSTLTQQLKEVADTVRETRCAAAAVIDGTRCDDVEARFIHISLAALPETPAKEKLLAIPTGLTIDRPDVDLLVQAGQEAVKGSAPLAAFLADYAPRPVTPGVTNGVTPGVRRRGVAQAVR